MRFENPIELITHASRTPQFAHDAISCVAHDSFIPPNTKGVARVALEKAGWHDPDGLCVPASVTDRIGRYTEPPPQPTGELDLAYFCRLFMWCASRGLLDR